jgi:hypothetical protein
MQEIINYVKENSYLEFEGDVDDKALLFATRRNGDTGYEEPGQADINEAKRIGRDVIKKYTNTKAEIEIVDEWVHLNIYIIN